MCDKYNGWSNHETWLINLHLSNNEGDYDYIREEIENRKFTTGSQDVYVFSDWLKDTYDPSELEDLGYGELPMMYSDLLNSAYRSANWYEIAEHWLTDYRADYPVKTTETYTLEYTAYDRYGRFWVEDSTDDFNETGYNFWEVFNAAIQNAIDHGYTSIEIVFNFNPEEQLSDHYLLIADQHKRNTPTK